MSTATAAPRPTGGIRVRDRADVRRQIRLVVVFGLVALLCLVFWLTTADPTIQYALGERISQENPAKTLNGGPLLVACFVASLAALALAAANRVPRGWVGGVVYAVVGLSFLISFLIWNYGDQTGDFAVALTNPLPEDGPAGDAARPGSAGRLPVRALGGHQHRDRGPVPHGARSSPRWRPASSSARRWASSAASSPGWRWRPCSRGSRCASTSTRWSSASC